MPADPIHASLESTRRLVVTKQRLTGPVKKRPSKADLLSVVRDLAYVQWDPVPIVAPSHLLSFWSRLGNFRPTDLDDLLWQDKTLFEHWTPMASLVLTEDYPLYGSLMRRYPDSLTRSWGSQRDSARRFLASRGALRKKILAELAGGPRAVSDFSEHARTKRDDGDWAPASDVAHLLFHLLMTGEVMVVGHRVNQNLYGLADSFLPDWVDRSALSEEEFERRAAERALRALGAATEREIHLYFPRGRYQNLGKVLTQLESESKVHRLVVDGVSSRKVAYVHAADIPLLESLQGTAWQPRVSLLPPFDNMVYSPSRSQRLFGFEYIREQFLPAEKRRYGTYVLPILSGENFIGRVDPRLNKESGTLEILSVHAEPAAPTDPGTAESIAEAIQRLGTFVGAKHVSYRSRVPAPWKRYLL
jgi:uncharacterized protein